MDHSSNLEELDVELTESNLSSTWEATERPFICALRRSVNKSLELSAKLSLGHQVHHEDVLLFLESLWVVDCCCHWYGGF